MSIVRIHSANSHALVEAYGSVAGSIDGVATDMGASYSEAMRLLDFYEHPDSRAPGRLFDLANRLTEDGSDLLWRIEFLESRDGADFDGLGRVDGTEAQRRINLIAEAFNISEQEAAELIDEISFEGAMDVAEHRDLLADLAEQAEGLFDVNPFTLTAEEIDARLAELSTAGPPRHQVELAILHALQDEFDAQDSDLPFLLDPSALADRNTGTRHDGEDHFAVLVEIYENDPLLADMSAIFQSLSDSQTSITSNQIDSYLNAEHDYSDPESIATVVSNTRAIFGVDELGHPTHTPEQLGISDDSYTTGLQLNWIAEAIELEIWAAEHLPADYLTAEEHDAIALIEQHFAALMATGAVHENPIAIHHLLEDGRPSHGLTWEQLEFIARGDHLTQPLIPGEFGNEELFLAGLLAHFDGVPGLTPESLLELQTIAQTIIASPRAFEALTGANDGTEVIQGEPFTGDLRGGIVAEDFVGFESQERLRVLIGQFSRNIDSITNGEIDGDISAEDFATFIIEQPDLPAELKDLLNLAIASGLTDASGWEKIQGAFETAGIVIGGLTLLAIPGGNVIVLSGLAVAGVVAGGGELYAAAQTGDDKAFAWALVGTVLDFIDVAEIGTIGMGFAAANAARRQGDEATAIAVEQMARDNPGLFDPVFRSNGDPMREIQGSGFGTPEWNDLVQDLKDQGFEVVVREGRSITYGPAPSAGRPGQIVIGPDASISALRHEAQHAFDDAANGFPGWGHYLEHPDARWAMEERAYQLEIQAARSLGREDIAQQLIRNMNAERETIYNPYGGIE